MFAKKKSTTDTRRVRTPQAASRGPVFSYYANRSVRSGASVRQVQEPPANDQQRLPRIAWRSYVPTVIVVILAVTLLGATLQLSDAAKVVTVGPSESHVFLRDKRIYEAAAHEAFDNVFNRNKLTVNTGKITADLQQRFPELAVVSISLPFMGTHPVVYIQPATPQLILASKNGMYILDSNGRALLSANQATQLESLKIPVVQDESSLILEAGKIVLPRATVAFITEVVGQLQAKKIEIASLTLPPGANELHVRPAGVGYYVKYNVHGKAREEAGAYLAVKARLESERKAPKEYIDVRVENKVYYK